MTGTVEDRERGYRAASIIVDRMLDRAHKRAPKRCTRKMQRSAAFRAGYEDGLLMAHCMLALGQFPLQVENAQKISSALTAIE
jgi:hypothetical protein